jgi:cytochrome P450
MSTLDPGALSLSTGHGANFNPMVSPDLEDPYTRYECLRREEPVSYSPLFDMWLVSRYDDVRLVLGDNKRFTTEGAFAQLSAAFEPEARELLSRSHVLTALNMFTSDMEHNRLRKPFRKFFTAYRITELEAIIRHRAAALIDRFPADGPVDLIESLAFPLPLQVIYELLGVPHEDRPRIQPGVEALGACMLTIVPPELQVETARQVLDYEQYVAELIELRRAEPRDDLISAVVRSVDSGQEQLSLPELVGIICENLILAGYETTVRGIGNVLHFLLSHREHWQELIADPGLIPKAVEELLRLHGVVVGFFRSTTEPVELRGVNIPAGENVLLLFGSANRDEERFPHPAVYDPHRPNLNEHIVFGHGAHYCLGAYLARLEIRVVLELLTTRLPGLRLVPDQQVPYTANIALRGVARLLAVAPDAVS